MAAAGGAVFAAVGDDLEVEQFPVGWGVEFFEIGFGLGDAAAVG